ncbi:hypothetical protein Tco_0144304 [Tanacetum coccineum]
MIAINSQKDSVSLLPLVVKPKKGKSQTVTPTLPKSQGPNVPGALSKKSKRPKSKNPPTKTKVKPPKPTEGSEQSHSVSSSTVPDPQDLERNIQLASMVLPSTLDEGTRKSKPLLESTAAHPKDLGGNIQPLDMDLTSTTSDEGTAKTTPRPEGSVGDKDSGGNIQPTDMEPIHPTVGDLSRTAFLLSEDELDQESDEEEVLADGEDMDEDRQVVKEVRTPSPKEDRPEPSNVQESTSAHPMSRVLFSRITGKQWEQHEEVAVSYADLKASIEEYYVENVSHRDQTEKLLLKDINNAVKDDPATNKKLEEAIETFAKISTNTIVVLSLVKNFDFSTLQSTMKDLQAHALKQEEVSANWTKSSTNMAWNLSSRMTAIEISQTALKHEVSTLRQDTSKIKSVMIEIYQAFKGQSSSAPSSSVIPTLALTMMCCCVVVNYDSSFKFIFS